MSSYSTDILPHLCTGMPIITLQFWSDIFRHLTKVRCMTGISKWRRCCSKGTKNIKNIIRCPLKRLQPSKLWEIRWSWSEKVRWDGGMSLRWDEWGVVLEVSLRLWWRHLADCRVQPPSRGGVVGWQTRTGGIKMGVTLRSPEVRIRSTLGS